MSYCADKVKFTDGRTDGRTGRRKDADNDKTLLAWKAKGKNYNDNDDNNDDDNDDDGDNDNAVIDGGIVLNIRLGNGLLPDGTKPL